MMRGKLMIFVGLLIILGSMLFFGFKPKAITTVISPSSTSTSSPSSKPTTLSSTPPSTPLPKSVLLAVPFLVQAPNGNWDRLHEEACEEASLANVLWFRNKRVPKDMHQGEEDIQKQVKWQEEHGYGVSITLAQLNTVAKEVYGEMTGRVVKKATTDSIKRELAQGRPVIVGAAGKILPNPFFKNGGPVYHMLVITGYGDNGVVDQAKCKRINPNSCDRVPGVFITNDVGIRQGEKFTYRYEALLTAIHDWDEKNILDGQKAYLVFE